MTTRCDVLVIGGGPAGATTALLLARAGWSVVLVERKSYPRRKVCGEYLSVTSLRLLDELGLGEVFRSMAGPPVCRVGLYAGSLMLASELPRPDGRGAEWGRALSREYLDTLLLSGAAKAGAEIYQPWSAVEVTESDDGYCCLAKSQLTHEVRDFRTGLIVDAHGSWETGSLPTHSARELPRPSDLLGFKAHFVNSDLPPGLMSLLCFPGGYGGIVHCDGGRVSLSCCIRRDRLNELRRPLPEREAGSAVLEHIRASCVGVRRALAAARNFDGWLAAGPIRPGIRVHANRGIFLVGNCAGEAHPVIAEGISMAMQGAWLLSDYLLGWRRTGSNPATLPEVGASYAAAWRSRFGPRLRVSTLLAHWAMHPIAVASAIPLVCAFPGLLTWVARLSGKASGSSS